MPPRSGHHRAKNINYDGDDAYSDEDYYEEEGAGDGTCGLVQICCPVTKRRVGITDEDRGTILRMKFHIRPIFAITIPSIN